MLLLKFVKINRRKRMFCCALHWANVCFVAH